MCASLGLGARQNEKAIIDKWEWIENHNPARDLGRPLPPLGWVLEVEGEIVGFFGNVTRGYRLGTRRLIVSTASSWAVRPPHRHLTARLAQAYFQQPNADLLMVTTAINAVGRLFRINGGEPMPVSGYRRVLFWIADPAGFARAALAKTKTPPLLAAAAAPAAAWALSGLNRFRTRPPGRTRAGLEPETVVLGSVGEEFDELWRRKLAEPERFMARRRAADLRWHFALATGPNQATILACRKAGDLAGYVVVTRGDQPALGLSRARIADLVAAGDQPDVVDALLAAAHDLARSQGVHVLELIGLPDAIRERALRSKPLARLLSPGTFWFKPMIPDLIPPLRLPHTWYPTLYDGDSSL